MDNHTTAVVWTAFTEQAQKHPRYIVSSMSDEISFDDLKRRAEQLEAKLAQAGIKPGDIVGLMIGNKSLFLIAFLALCKLSVSVALISNRYHKREIEAINENIRPFAFLCENPLRGSISDNITIENTIALFNEDETDEPVLLMPSRVNGETPNTSQSLQQQHGYDHPVSLIKFTSGTSGVPKAVALSSKNILAEARNVIETLKINDADRILTPVPLSHSYGFDLGVLSMIFAGAQLIIHDSFIPRICVRTIEKAAVTIFLGVPSMYRFMLDLHYQKEPDFSRVRYFLSCTAPLTRTMFDSFYDLFNQPLCQHYGSSETGAAANQRLSDVMKSPEAVGVPMKNVDIQIVDENGKYSSSGQIGEIVISGESVAMGYLMGRPENDPLKNGTYRTGDLGWFDDDKCLYLEGRKDLIINVGGNKVSPREVTEILERFPAVSEAAVMGYRDHNDEEIVLAVVSLNAPTDENEILDYCRGKLAPYKIPRRIEIRKELPKSDTGKIKLRPEDYGL